VGRARRHHDPAALQRGGRGGHGRGIERNGGAGRDRGRGCRHDVERLGHAARAVFAARHHAVAGADREHAVGREGRPVAARGGVEPHADVHGGGQQHALVGGEQQGRGEVVGEALGHLGHEVRGSGRHHQEFGAARQLDMAHLGLVGEREQVVVDPAAREARHRQRCDEALGGFRHHGPDLGAALAQPADQVERLIGRDAAPDDQQDPPPRQNFIHNHRVSHAVLAEDSREGDGWHRGGWGGGRR